MAKDFSTINTGSRVSETIKEATRRTGQQDTAPAAEAEKRKAEGKTQGRKGVKLPRVNLALTQLNYDYVKTCARASGQTNIAFINSIITQHRETHPEEYETAKKLLNGFQTVKLPTTPAEAEAFIVRAVEDKQGLQPGSLDLTQAVDFLLQEYQARQEEETGGEE